MKASEKIAGGFCDNKSAAPYGDGKTYLAPMFYSPCGLVYNAELFREKGWALPATWDEMWILGDLAAEENIALFTYPTADNCDTFLLALMHAIGGPEFSEAVTAYEADAWDSGNGKPLLSILDKLAGYTHPSTPAHANNQDFIRNQRLVMTNDALFMPSGTWISSLMAGETETLENAFAWGSRCVLLRLRQRCQSMYGCVRGFR